MAEQIELEHDITGLTALFPAGANFDHWAALGWHKPSTEPSAEKADTPAARPSRKRDTESEEKA